MMGFVVFAGFAACIAWSARAGRSRAAGRTKCPGTRSALLKSANASFCEGRKPFCEGTGIALMVRFTVHRRYTYGTHLRHTGESYQSCPAVPQSTTNAGRFASGGGATLPPRGPRVMVMVMVRVRVRVSVRVSVRVRVGLGLGLLRLGSGLGSG